MVCSASLLSLIYIRLLILLLLCFPAVEIALILSLPMPRFEVVQLPILGGLRLPHLGGLRL